MSPSAFKATFQTKDGRRHEWTVNVRRWAWARRAFFEEVRESIPVETIVLSSVRLAPMTREP